MTVFRLFPIAVSILALGSGLISTATAAQITGLPMMVRRLAQIPSPSPSPRPSPTAVFAQVEQEVHRQINAYRASKKLSPLTWNEQIANQARQHSQNMASKKVPLGHQGFQDRIKAIQIPHSRVGENVAYNQGYDDPATQAVQSWLKSSAHKANIEGAYNLTGIGMVKDAEGRLFFTQIFVKSP
jgi:uncharacterized protein YkwD